MTLKDEPHLVLVDDITAGEEWSFWHLTEEEALEQYDKLTKKHINEINEEEICFYLFKLIRTTDPDYVRDHAQQEDK